MIRSWVHSGFSVESETRMLDKSTKEALGQYAVRDAVSEQRISYDSDADLVTWSATFRHAGRNWYAGMESKAELELTEGDSESDPTPRNARLLGPASQEELGPPAEKGLRGRPAPLPKLRRNHGGGRNHRMGRWATVSPHSRYTPNP